MQVAGIAGACLTILLVSPPRLHAQSPLAAASTLYASAEYDDALRLLDSLSPGSYSREERQALELYRTLCLLAVGRRADADGVMEAMIVDDPLYRPADDVTPRMRAAFSDVKKRVLPAVIQRQYDEAKSAFDRQDFEAAATGFQRVMKALSDPDISQAAKLPPLSDLRTLATGFQELSIKAIPPAPPPSPVVAAPPPPVNQAPTIYRDGERNVAPPLVIRQELPNYPGKVPAGGLRGVVEIVINEAGAVESALVVESVGDVYDRLVLEAAVNWRYRPATVNGAPVKFRKRIGISLVFKR